MASRGRFLELVGPFMHPRPSLPFSRADWSEWATLLGCGGGRLRRSSSADDVGIAHAGLDDG
jgi:hypothetical protein